MRRSARTDLCGGRSAMIVPTATAKLIHYEFSRPSGLRRASQHPSKWPILGESASLPTCPPPVALAQNGASHLRGQLSQPLRGGPHLWLTATHILSFWHFTCRSFKSEAASSSLQPDVQAREFPIDELGYILKQEANRVGASCKNARCFWGLQIAVPKCRQNSAFSDSSEKWSFVKAGLIAAQRPGTATGAGHHWARRREGLLGLLSSAHCTELWQ